MQLRNIYLLLYDLLPKLRQSLEQGFMQLQLVALVALHGQFPLTGTAAHQHTHLLPLRVEVPVRNPEVRKQHFVLRLDPHFRVAHDDVEVVVGHSPAVLLRQREHLPIGQRNQQSVLVRGLFGDETSLGVAGEEGAVFEGDDDDEMGMVVDVLV